MRSKTLTFLLTLSMVLVTVVGGPAPNVAANPSAEAPDLGTAASFVGLAASTFTNTGDGVYYGNVGVFPGSAVEGFPPGTVENGEIYRGGAIPEQAQIDALAGYNDLAGRPCNTNLTSQDLGGMTLPPGVYCFNTSAQLTGDLVLDAMGDPNAVWVFQTGSTLTTASGSTVRLINGAQIFNVFWQVGTSATLGTTTRFKGTIIADQSITLETGAGLSGRALALNGGVTMDTEGSPPISNPQLGIVKQVYPVSAIPDQVITYTITFANYGSELVTGIMISDTIPISVTNTSVISSGVAITQVQDTRYAWEIAPLEVGQGGIITITGQLSSTLPSGMFTNTATITSTELERDFENDTSSASVIVAAEVYTLTVNIVGRGSVTAEPPGTVILPPGTIIFPYTFITGTVVTLTATPDTGWHFTGWSGDLSGVANPEELTMDTNKAVTATFMTKIYLPLVQRNHTP